MRDKVGGFLHPESDRKSGPWADVVPAVTVYRRGDERREVEAWSDGEAAGAVRRRAWWIGAFARTPAKASSSTVTCSGSGGRMLSKKR